MQPPWIPTSGGDATVFDWQLEPEHLEPRDYAERRVEGRMYVSRSFRLKFDSSRDYGQLARYATRVFDPGPLDEPSEESEWTQMVIYSSPHGRIQLRAMVAREAGAVRQITLERVTPTSLDTVATLNREQSHGLIDFIRALEVARQKLLDGCAGAWLSALVDLDLEPAHHLVGFVADLRGGRGDRLFEVVTAFGHWVDAGVHRNPERATRQRLDAALLPSLRAPGRGSHGPETCISHHV